MGLKIKATTVYGDEKEDLELNKEDYDENAEDDENESND